MRAPEEFLTDESIKFAEKYINAKFKGKDMTEVSMAVNGSAHGYFMGWRDSEKKWNRFLLPRTKNMEEIVLQNLSLKAAQEYIKKRKFNRLPYLDQALISMTVAYGFRHGVRAHELR